MRARRSTIFSLLGISLLAAATHCSTHPGPPPGETDAGKDATGDTAVGDAAEDGSEPSDGAADGSADAADSSSDADASTSGDSATDAPADAISDAPPDASNPRCDAPANLFDPGDRCGVELALDLQCSHSITQQAMSAGCCVPKNPGVACVPTAPPDTNCCVNPGIYCGLVEETTHTVPVTLRLTRGARSGLHVCQFGASTTLGTTKVDVTPLTGPKAGITLALSIFEKPRCVHSLYYASFTRVDTADTYGGSWIDHPSVSQNRDSSGSASVTLNPDMSITYTATGRVPMDTGAGTPTWIRRTNVADCVATAPPPGVTGP